MKTIISIFEDSSKMIKNLNYKNGEFYLIYLKYLDTVVSFWRKNVHNTG